MQYLILLSLNVIFFGAKKSSWGYMCGEASRWTWISYFLFWKVTRLIRRYGFFQLPIVGNLPQKPIHLDIPGSPVDKWSVNGLYNYNLLINGIFLGYNPLTNLLLTSWDIQAVGRKRHCFFLELKYWTWECLQGESQEFVARHPETNSLHLKIDDWNTAFISYVMFGRLLNVVFEHGTFDFRVVLAYSGAIC